MKRKQQALILEASEEVEKKMQEKKEEQWENIRKQDGKGENTEGTPNNIC